MKKKPPVYASSIMALAAALERNYQGVYKLEKAGRFKREARGYHIEKIREKLATGTAQAAGVGGDSDDDDSIRTWDRLYRKWRSKKAQIEYEELSGQLVDKSLVQREQLRRETTFVREVRRLQFILPARLHNQPLEEWPALIDQAASECLSTIVRTLDKLWESESKPKKTLKKVAKVSTKRKYRVKPGPKVKK